MKFFISLNELRRLNEPKLQIEMLSQMGFYELVDGIEINANLDDPLEVIRLYEYADILDQNDKSIQIHVQAVFSNHYNDYDYLSNALSIYGKLADRLKTRLIVVIHSVEHEAIDVAEYRTLKLLDKLYALRTVYQYDLDFVIENLIRPRMDSTNLYRILNKYKTPFCWDVGHAIMNGYEPLLPLEDTRQLKNVHLHDVNQTDHQPFIYGKTDYYKIISYLKKNNYRGAIVIEIAYDNLRGSNLSDKLEDYLCQVALVKNAYETISSLNYPPAVKKAIL
ncbi:sugar phosphate isomerase/epimerase [Acidaminobacter sp. JC074]|uniref:sugar phosphate isomerase/epimerase family protein n=1 Tax=Acidaminobacter sp. JC074 TaxID=2530199 RepID=UPI001F107516|nr:TIM barrel protein [Acidaminobacter sp. JC074]MCH4891019.1 sugar phosphate isomerase/epimerase [Acidaminobacter sp. JC074]